VAENEKCIKRLVAIADYREAFVDHHEWRFLRQGMIYGDAYSNPPTNATVLDSYYCIFCLKRTEREVKDGTPTQYR
jgi:hypothetical protein